LLDFDLPCGISLSNATRTQVGVRRTVNLLHSMRSCDRDGILWCWSIRPR